MPAFKAQHDRWSDLKNRHGRRASMAGHVAAQEAGCHYVTVVKVDNLTRDLAAADELRAPGRLSEEDMRRELGEAR